jgi:hypothetical protein
MAMIWTEEHQSQHSSIPIVHDHGSEAFSSITIGDYDPRSTRSEQRHCKVEAHVMQM